MTDRKQTENRQRTEKPITEAPLITILMEHRVEQANNRCNMIIEIEEASEKLILKLALKSDIQDKLQAKRWAIKKMFFIYNYG